MHGLLNKLLCVISAGTYVRTYICVCGPANLVLVFIFVFLELVIFSCLDVAILCYLKRLTKYFYLHLLILPFLNSNIDVLSQLSIFYYHYLYTVNVHDYIIIITGGVVEFCRPHADSLIQRLSDDSLNEK